ncbi:MAG: AbrB/MazE/SpoVT family DNA-binding domain-containing protein [Chloroflexota bacterium]|mgnify:CR=1 FL=1
MQTRIQKWGNSLAIRIPSAFAQTARLKDSTVVEVSLVNGRIVISLARPPRPKLKSLLSKITPRNLHGEIETGEPIGKEIW